MVRGIRISQRGNIHNFDIPDTISHIQNVTIYQICYVCKAVGRSSPEVQATWKLSDGSNVCMWGWTQGNNPNRFDFPPISVDAHLSEVFYGDVVLLATEESGSGRLIDFTNELFNSWYEEAMGGFESLGEEDTDDENTDIDDYRDDDSFIDDRPLDELSTYSDSILDNSDSFTDDDSDS